MLLISTILIIALIITIFYFVGKNGITEKQYILQIFLQRLQLPTYKNLRQKTRLVIFCTLVDLVALIVGRFLLPLSD